MSQRVLAFERFQEVQKFQEVLENPRAFGCPTFEEFKNARSKYVGKADDILASAEEGSTQFAKFVRKQKYIIKGYEAKTTEEVERIALNEGMVIKDLEYIPQMIEIGGGKWDVHVHVMEKKDYEKTRREMAEVRAKLQRDAGILRG